MKRSLILAAALLAAFQFGCSEKPQETPSGSSSFTKETCTVCSENSQSVNGITTIAPTPESKPALTPELNPAPAPESKPAPAPESKPAPAPESKPALTPESKPALTPELNPAPTPESKPAPAPESKPAPAPESKPAPAPESKPAPAPESKPAPAPESKPAPAPESKPAPAPESKPAPAPESKPAPAPESKPAPAPESKPAAEVKPAVATGLTGDKFSSDKDSVQRVIELVKKLDGKYVLSASGDLTLINIDGAALTVEGFDLIVKQTELETLQVANFRGLNDAAFTKITGLKKLKTLAITNAIITDASVALIAKSFPLLRNLDLSRNALLTDDALSSVGKLKELESLLVNYCTFSEFGLMSIEKMPKLRTLDIRGNVKIDGSGLGVVAKISSLRALKHRSEMVDDNAISELAAAKNLEIFDMQDFAITDAAGEELKKLPKLSQLIIFRCLNFGSQGLLALKGKALTRLTLRDLPSLDDTGMEAFRELTALKRLYLHELNSVTDVGMMNLVYLKNLETLDIWSMSEITDKSIESIAKLQNLKNISIRSTKITDKSIDLLLSLPKLQELTLKDNASITKEAKTKLKEAKKIKTLILN